MATSPKIMHGSTQITKVIVNGTEMYDVNVVKDGVTTRVYHKHTSACYSAGHTHTDSCYKICGGQLYTPYGSHYIHVCRSCGHTSSNMYDADQDAVAGADCNEHGTCDNKILICGQEEGASTLICGYDV